MQLYRTARIQRREGGVGRGYSMAAHANDTIKAVAPQKAREKIPNTDICWGPTPRAQPSDRRPATEDERPTHVPQPPKQLLVLPAPAVGPLPAASVLGGEQGQGTPQRPEHTRCECAGVCGSAADSG
eukprot:4559876-Prymnesium_polylepis.1